MSKPQDQGFTDEAERMELFEGGTRDIGNDGRSGVPQPEQAREDVTPAILLEQLAYVDNFMTDLDNDFSNLDMLLEGGDNNNVGGMLSLDERLAAELSAFADDSFIFPDEEEKPGRGEGEPDKGPSDLSNEQREQGVTGSSTRKINLLSERRTNFLMSHYDHTRQRFSKRNDIGTNRASPQDDHGSFVNFDTLQPPERIHDQQDGEGSNTVPLSVPVFNNTSHYMPEQADTAHTSSWTQCNIQMPDYASIPTSVLVALLPKVEIPPGAQRSLELVGFTRDQIDAVAAIMAYHQTKGSALYNSSVTAAAAAAATVGYSNAIPPSVMTIPEFRYTVSNGLHVPGEANTMVAQNLHQAENSANASDNPANFFLDLLSHQDEARPAVGSSANTRSRSFAKTTPSPVMISRSGYSLQRDQTTSIGTDKADVEHQSSDLHYGDNSTKQSRIDNGSYSIRPSQETSNELVTHKTSDANLIQPGGQATNESKERKRSLSENPRFPKDVISDTTDQSNSYSNTHTKPHLKRKQKEEELKKSAQELSELAATLKQKIQTLEMENRLLKDMVIEKGQSAGIERAGRMRREILARIHDDK